MNFVRQITCLFVLFGCGTVRTSLPTTVHNATATGFAGEVGGLYGLEVEDSAKKVSTSESETLKTSNGSGFLALMQYDNLYAKFDAAPLPGMWFGLGLTDPKPGRFGWYPSIEIALSGDGESGTEETTDGFLEDDAGNRYLYEIKRQRGGFGIAVPQIFEFYPVKKFGLYLAATPTYINEASKTEVELVYERERRIVNADPALDAEFEDIVTYEQRGDDSSSRWLMPLSLGTRFQMGPFHLRFAYVTRRVDSVRNYESSYRDVFLLTFGYVGKAPSKTARPRPVPSSTRSPRGRSKTTTTTTTTPDGKTTTTTTTTPEASDSRGR